MRQTRHSNSIFDLWTALFLSAIAGPAQAADFPAKSMLMIATTAARHL
jgi:hypothetical protein